jgi:hypothetical protein
MSRIIRSAYTPGELADATRANTEWSAFSQPGGIDGYNLRDAAIDLPQLGTGIIIRNIQSIPVGTGASGWQHSAPKTVLSAVAAPATKSALVDAGGTPTPLGPIAWTISPGEILRVYWDLSVRPRYEGTPWVGNDGEIPISTIAGSPTNINLGAHCWLVSLQWDVTDATLTNWTDVSGQTGYTSAIGSTTGGRLSDSPAAVPVPAWKLSTTNIMDGEWWTSATEEDDEVGWTSVNGAWYFTPQASLTIYGLRLVIHGIYHPAQTATENYLVVDPGVGAVTQVLQYDGGTLTAIHMRTGA